MFGSSRHTNATRSIRIESAYATSRNRTRKPPIALVMLWALGSVSALALFGARADGREPVSIASATAVAELASPGAKAAADARRAAELYNAEDWAGAATLYASALAVNPDRGNQWDAYASALHNLGRYEESLAAWERCAALGFRTGESLYNCACAEARLGHTDRALDRLARALDEGYWDEKALAEDEDLAAIRSHARFVELTGVGVPALDDRNERWRRDLDFLATRIAQIHWAPFARAARDSFYAAVAATRAKVPALSDGEIEVAIRRLLTMVGDGHTLLFGDGDVLLADPMTGQRAMHGSASSFPRYPLAFALFSDGLFVTRAAEPLRALAGARVVSLGGVKADEALSRMTPYCSVDNEMGLKVWRPFLLASPDVAAAAGLTDRSGAMEIEARCADGTVRRFTVNPKSEADDGSAWISMSPADEALPSTLRDRHRPYWFAPLDGTRFTYLQFNQTVDDPSNPLAAFWPSLFAAIDSSDAEGLVIDLRNNFGGNKALFEPLVDGVRRMDRINQRDRLFVIVGRRTFSAAMCGAASLERSTRAIFVGEPTGSSPNFVGEIEPVTLPYSRLSLSISNRYHQNAESTDRRTWIGPHIAAPPSSSDWIAGRDAAIEAIRAHLAAASASVAP